MNEALTWILDTVQSVDPALRTLLAGVGVMLETSVLIGLLIPGDTILLVASTAVADPVQYVALVGAVVAGALVGESIGFALGRYLGPWLRASRAGRRLGEERWRRAERYLERRGGVAVFLSRFLPVLHSLIPLTVGMSPMRYRRFMAWTVPACVLWSFAYVSAGALAAQGYREVSGRLHYAGVLFVAAIVLFVGVVYLVKRLLHRAESKHMDAEPGAGADEG